MYDLSSWEFDREVADVFDQHVRQSIPLYDMIQQSIVRLADFFLFQHEQGVLYDVGCATGETLHQLHLRHPHTTMSWIGIDGSMAMLDKAKEKNSSLSHITWVQENIKNYSFPLRSNLTISLMTIQFLPIEDRKTVLQKIYDSLFIGGALLIVEKTMASHSITQDIYTQIYHDLKETEGLSANEIRNKEKALRSQMRLQTKESLTKELKETGFEVVETFFELFHFVGMIAIKR